MGTTVLVTGSSRGLGLEFVRQCAARGDTVIATLRDPAKSPEVARLAKHTIPLDVTDPKSVASLVSDLKGTPIDILINNAGVMGQDKQIGKLTIEDFRTVFETNTFAPALLAQALVPNLKAGTRKMIANISSELGSITQGVAGFSYAYNASKSALNRITVQMAKDLRREGILVMTFCPGWNKTDMGGPNAPLEAKDSIAKLLVTMDGLTLADSGKYLRIDGTTIPW
jgi:NAD(P)-dependent dehydrogenase (short-subunit alcohol dehydrogenase family)